MKDLKKILSDLFFPSEKTAKAQERAGQITLGLIVLILSSPIFIFYFLKFGLLYLFLSPALYFHKKLKLSKSSESSFVTGVCIVQAVLCLTVLAVGARLWRYGTLN